jgi:uncharacterized protein (DUF2126 family)
MWRTDMDGFRIDQYSNIYKYDRESKAYVFAGKFLGPLGYEPESDEEEEAHFDPFN